MSPVSHQTVRLARGRHTSPDQGACVMELASMLAGEHFSDTPAAVCPVIGAFLRPLNDGLDPEARQRLYPIAARIVGTANDGASRRARRERCRERNLALRGRVRSRTGRAFLLLLSNGAASACAAAFLANGTIDEAIAFVDDLIAMGDRGVAAGGAPHVVPDTVSR